MKNIINLDNLELIPNYDYNNGVGDTNFLLKKDGDTYYVKNSNYPYKELVISEFCHLIDIPCVNYELAEKDNEYYVISKSYRHNDCKYITGKELIVRFLDNTDKKTKKELSIYNVRYDKLNNLETIWLSLADNYAKSPTKYNDIRNVMIELLKQYFLMILIQDIDFHWFNWEIEESEDHIKLAPKYDNEGAFGGEYYGVPMGVDGDDPFQRTTDSISRFINITANEDNELFLDLYNKATPELFQKAINNVKERYDIEKLLLEDSMISKYQEQYDRLGTVLKEKGLKR